MKGLVCILLFLFLATVVFAQQITAYWSLTWNGNCSNSVGPISGTPIVRSGPAPVPSISYSSKGAGSTNWNASSFDQSRYYEYKLTANANVVIGYCQLNMESTCPYLHSQIRYSLDNFSSYSTMLSNYDFNGVNPYTYVNNALDIPMASGQTLTVRVYGWGALYASNIFYNQTFYLCGHQTDITLPVELASFTAALSIDGNIVLDWVTQSETNILGYHVYRNTENLISTAVCLTQTQGLIPAANTSYEHTYSFIDDEVGTDHVTYFYWLQYTEFSGEVFLTSPFTIEVNGGDTPIPPADETSLQSIFPNPYKDFTTIKYGLKTADRVSISVYNIKGQLVNRLESGFKSAGTYENLKWYGTDTNGTKCASGIYYIVMHTGSVHTVHKVVKF